MGSLCAGAWLEGVGAIRSFNISRATVPAVHAAGSIVLFAAGSRSVRLFATAMLIGVAASWIVAGVQGPFRAALCARPSWSLAGRMAHYGSRMQFGSWANAANVRFDQLLLSILAPAAALGIYVVGVSYAGLLVPIPFSATFVMLPHVVDRHRAGLVRECVEQWYRRLWWTTLAAGAAPADFQQLSKRLALRFAGGRRRPGTPGRCRRPSGLRPGLSRRGSRRHAARPGRGDSWHERGVVDCFPGHRTTGDR